MTDTSSSTSAKPTSDPTSLGVLYGVGVGPGASDLMTLRAVRTINSVDVLAIPRPNPHSPSLAHRIIKPNLEDNPEQEQLLLTFPMTKDKEKLRPHWQYAYDEVAKRLAEGKSVGFISQGDPLFYSTFVYLMSGIRHMLPEVKIEAIPAVTGVSAVAAAVTQPLVDGSEKLAILPASYLEDAKALQDILRRFDTVALMKVSSVMPMVIEALENEELLTKAVYVERASTTQERIVTDLLSLKNDRCVYFSMVIVCKKVGSGVLDPFGLVANLNLASAGLGNQPTSAPAQAQPSRSGESSHGL